MQKNLVSDQTQLSELAQNQLLPAIWRSPDSVHFIGTLDRHTGKFKNTPVKSAAEAHSFALAYSAMGLDSYFACADYENPDSRVAINVIGAWAFWVDIDVGPDKAASGKGYETEEEAIAAQEEFCAKAGLPEPTFIVRSGSGIHSYWTLDKLLTRDQWQAYAAKLKALMKCIGLHADPSRTADIASVLRVPGTLNNKYAPAREVTMLSASDEHIDLTVMLDAIDAAVVKFGTVSETAATNEVPESVSSVPVPLPNDFGHEPPNMLSLTSALVTLPPDCDERTWKFHRIGPMAYEARYFPEMHDALYSLARRWSSGDLCGVPSVKWNTPGSNGYSGKQLFDHVWKRFLTDTYTGKRVTLGTIFFHAKEAGWVYVPDQTSGLGDDGEDLDV